MKFINNFSEVGKRIANPPPGQNIVISGVSGKFPNSHSFVDYCENLMKKRNLCDEDERRFEHFNTEIPRNYGKLRDLQSFDPGFFGVNPHQAHYLEPSIRIILEATYEAIIDAGLCVQDFAGSNTGVFIGNCWSETQYFMIGNKLVKNSFCIFGTAKCAISNYISYWLKLNGPAYMCDTACSSSMYAFEAAYKSIREGKCDRAIVGGTNILLDPMVSLQFAHLGVLNVNKQCRPFDSEASGYTRSESVCIVILQKSQDARRIYAEVVHVKSNADGFKSEGITFPSTQMQIELLEEVYDDCGVSVNQIGFLEAHGTGTLVGDVQELNAIDKVFFGNGKRQEPLLIGSVKGNIGHGEASSGLNSIAKVLYAMESGRIPPNIHYDKPRQGVEGLATGRLKVVTEVTNWPENAPYVGVNSFGFGGANTHVLLKRYRKSNIIKPEKIPRLVCFSGRTEECIASFQNALQENPNKEIVRLLQSAFRKKVPNNYFYGYSIISESGELKRSMNNSVEEKPLYLCIGSQNKYNKRVLSEFSKFPLFSKSVDEFNEVLRNNKLNNKVEDSDLTKQIMLSLSIQLSLINLLKALNLNPTHILGAAFGNFAAAYANDALTFEEAIFATYFTTKVLLPIPSGDSKKVYEELISSLKLVLRNGCKGPGKHVVSKENPFDYATPEYFVFNILNPKKTAEIEEESVVVSINFEERLENKEVVNLIKSDFELESFLEGIGRLYELGYELNVEEIYPKASWPVNSGTPTISHLVKWNHERKHFVADFGTPRNLSPYGFEKTIYDSDDHACGYLKGHVIDGRNLFPATGYIITIIDHLRKITKTSFSQQIICFENVQFLKATTFGEGKLTFNNFISKSGDFEIVEGEAPIVTGKIKIIENLEPFDLPEFEESEVNLSQKDIYKELRLRGYNYTGLFCAIQEVCGNRAKIQWNDNYVSFLDNMLQLAILQEDSRGLYVPTGIEQLILNVPAHEAFIESNKENSNIPVYIDSKTKSLRTHGVSFVGIKSSSISRKKEMLEPILEINKFVPNESKLELNEALKVNAQIILENTNENSFNVLEQLEEERTPLTPIFKKSLEDNPLIIINTKIITQLELKFEEIAVVKESITAQNNYFVYIGRNLLQRPDEFGVVLNNISQGGYLLVLEDHNVKIPNSLVLITKYSLNGSSLYMFKKKETQRNDFVAVNISEDLSWVSSLQNIIKSKKNVIIYAENQPDSGILGLTNCLKREIQTVEISCFFLEDAPKFEANSEFYQKQISKNLRINVFKHGNWGTYRHLPFEDKLCEREHSFGNVLRFGDLNSLKWIEGPISSTNQDIIYVYNSALNFRDLMTASGKVSVETITTNRNEQECIQGLEFTGRNIKGERLMGIVSSGAISTYVVPNKNMLWKIPDSWTMQEAASVPVVYSTVLLALKIRVNVRRGQSILIHSGTGGIGLAAINVALHYGLEIFTTVGTQEKRDYLTKNYPQIKPSNIGNSRDSSFEQMVLRNTNYRGVDYVLNSLAEEKLLASIRCLAKNGTFLEIGKFDISKDTKISMDLQSKGAAFSGVMLDKLMLNGAETSSDSKKLINLLQEGINQGFIKPLPVTIFEREQLQEAFRFIGTGKHIGKIVIRQRREENEKRVRPKAEKSSVIPRSYFNPEASYVILGGLGGFGLELADWMALRGARNIILSSRNGVKNGYQQYVIRKLKGMGVKVEVTTENIRTYAGCEKIYEQATSLGQLEGIFNLAVDLRDGMFENLTTKDFELSLGPKAVASNHFDKITRKNCSHLKYFVLFSSVSCGRGNAGQANYCLSNSVMERLCEKRRADGLPGLAIQWGAVGDVGLVAEMQKEQNQIIICGTLQQRISSCLEVLDKFLQSDEAVVASMVIAEKGEKKKSDNMVDAVINVLGIRDLKTVSGHATLPELGMDSMMSVEIKQLLEREYDIFLSAADFKSLTINKLIEMDNSESAPANVGKPETADSFDTFFNTLYNETNYHLPKIDFVEDEKQSKVFFFPGIEGTATVLVNLLKRVSKNSTCLQYISTKPLHKLDDIVNNLWPHIVSECKQGFKFVAHSLGATIALETASRLERLGIKGRVVVIDGSPALSKLMASALSSLTNKELQCKLLVLTCSAFVPKDIQAEFKDKLSAARDFEEMQDIMMELVPETKQVSRKMLSELTNYCLNSTLVSLNYVPTFAEKVKSRVILCKPTVPIVPNIAEDLQLSEICETVSEIRYFDGDHKTIVDNPDLLEAIVKFLD